MYMLPAFLLERPPPAQFSAFLLDLPAPGRLFLYLYVPSFLFAPAFLWLFARECPRLHRRARLDDLARRMVPASVTAGFAIRAACAVTLAQAVYAWGLVPLVFDGLRRRLGPAGAGDGGRRRAAGAHSGRGGRRAVLFSAGFLMHVGLATAYDLAHAFTPRFWVANYHWSPTVLVMEVRFPGMALAVVLGGRRAGASRPRGGAGLLPAAADAAGPAAGGGDRAGPGPGLAGGEPSRAHGGRSGGGPAGAVAVRSGRHPAARGARPPAAPAPARRLDAPGGDGPESGPGQRGGGTGPRRKHSGWSAGR